MEEVEKLYELNTTLKGVTMRARHVADVVLFLASGESELITGHDLVVDGGFQLTRSKYNIFMAQIGCAAIGVLAFSILGPGWLARSTALAASIAFMIYARASHPPAASLPLLFIDGVKLHQLNFWYALFPGAAGCVILCLIINRHVTLKLRRLVGPITVGDSMGRERVARCLDGDACLTTSCPTRGRLLSKPHQCGILDGR
ncbi:hypothetical protein JRO89_XS13G0176500 [Xanthoceras sorbifolium]|uniref:HPP transmembrane region domain-containing protein n=1 Tax=Xanthoceras sorbifolium TaxID=99658 RepID=A0ABQ8H8Y7_9ROSI|nr:hypothetical protein JRO89_XS13G0176500 [Xanthoceras sorbifolium]